ncbi:MAG TPA: lipid II flippase MurJ, partial [Chthonomonadaceae bacterium]|nr:lipid II flippase MurJ [Chthonomonadaceae bacterium]
MRTTEPRAGLSEAELPRSTANGHGAGKRMVQGTLVIMAGVLLSRLLGLVRVSVIAHQFGQGYSTDIYNAAFTIPDVIFYLIAGGALSSSFIPVFTEYIE